MTRVDWGLFCSGGRGGRGVGGIYNGVGGKGSVSRRRVVGLGLGVLRGGETHKATSNPHTHMMEIVLGV